MCFFDSVKQDYVKIGTYDPEYFSSPENDAQSPYLRMKFINGQHCYNGVTRSALVRLQCGDKNEIVNVYEPSPCVYEILVNTFALCDHDELEKAEKEVDFWSREKFEEIIIV